MKTKVIHTSVTANPDAQTLSIIITMLGRLTTWDRQRILRAVKAWFPDAQV